MLEHVDALLSFSLWTWRGPPGLNGQVACSDLKERLLRASETPINGARRFESGFLHPQRPFPISVASATSGLSLRRMKLA